MTQICGERGLCSSCGARASRWRGSSSCRGWALGRSGSRSCSAWAQGLWLPGSEASGVVAHRLQEWWHTGFRSGGAQASGVVAHRLQEWWRTGLVALRHVGSSWTRDQTCVPWVGDSLPLSHQQSPWIIWKKTHTQRTSSLYSLNDYSDNFGLIRSPKCNWIIWYDYLHNTIHFLLICI